MLVEGEDFILHEGAWVSAVGVMFKSERVVTSLSKVCKIVIVNSLKASSQGGSMVREDQRERGSVQWWC